MAKLTYSEEFDALHLWDGTSGLDTRPGWAMHWWAEQGFAWTAASETWYVQPSDPGTAHLNPFRIDNGVLTISARRSGTEFSDHKGTYHYTSGVLTTFNDFQQTYGYFEIRAKLKLDAGTLPAFWLMRADGTWPPELDVMEILGSDPTTLIGTVHSQVDGVTIIDPTHYQTAMSTSIPDAGAAFHTYGVDWQADKITWYFDGKPIFQVDTPSDMHGPMYMIANLNVGGTWEGYPDEGKTFASDFLIDYIRAYDSFPVTLDDTAENHLPTDLGLDSGWVWENAQRGSPVGVLKAKDADGDNLTYTLLNDADGRFAIQGNKLVVADGIRLDYEQARSHVVTVEVSDGNGGTAIKSFTIEVQDVVKENVRGGGASDVIKGGSGADTIGGGLGKDVLTGGKDKDIFVFDTKASKANVDRITDFNVKEDSIHLDNMVFTKLGKKGSEASPAKLNKDFFTIGSKAKEKDDYLVYDNKKGVLYYDADGSGKGKAVEIATLSKNLKMTAADFFVI